MRPLRARPVDHHTATLARARVARLAGPERVEAVPPSVVPGGSIDDGYPGAVATIGMGGRHRRAGTAGSVAADSAGPRGVGGLGWLAGGGPAGGGPVGDDPDDGGADGTRADGSGRYRAGVDGAEDAGDEPRGGRAPGDHPSAGAAEPEQEWAASVRDHLPLTVRAKLGLERGHAAVIVLVALLGVLGAAVVFLLARPEVVPVDTELTATGTPAAPDEDAPPPEPESEAEPDDPPAADGAESHGGVPADDGSAASAPAGTIMVHVAGLVAEPGVVELPAGVRVVDAIEAAGGPAADADLTPLNLARVLTDGEQVVVTAEPPPGQPAEPPPAPGTGPDDATAGGPVDLNTATADDLDTLPGIGPTLAGRILEWREHNGRFTTVDELREVSGIGEQRFAELEPLVTV